MRGEWQIRKEIVEIGRKVYAKDLVAATDGNISVRATGDTLLITPSGSCLGELGPSDLVYADFAGRVLSGPADPSSELPMHIAAYQERPDIRAIIHAHPPITTALTLAGLSLAQCVIPEIVLVFGCIPTAAYATPSSREGPEAIRSLVRKHDALVLDRHGSLTVGKDLTDAFRKLEKVEYCARVTHAARQVGNLKTLTADEVNRLEEIRKQMGLGDGSSLCNLCGTCGKDA
ncbi:MAG: class II aldolase/adducin family protein [Candidatus Eisenbacteria sp.]|nr:class II aldolase/adducin family protein [Candidatus Eisenbacteria bacterium]